jgi:hypothetical protein
MAISVTLQNLLKDLVLEHPQLKLEIDVLSGHAVIQLAISDTKGRRILSYDPISIEKNNTVDTSIYLDPQLNRITLEDDSQIEFKKAEEKPVDSRQKMIDDGMVYYCLACKRCYRELPMVNHETGHGDRTVMNQCRHCYSYLFARLSDDSPA